MCVSMANKSAQGSSHCNSGFPLQSSTWFCKKGFSLDLNLWHIGHKWKTLEAQRLALQIINAMRDGFQKSTPYGIDNKAV